MTGKVERTGKRGVEKIGENKRGNGGEFWHKGRARLMKAAGQVIVRWLR